MATAPPPPPPSTSSSSSMPFFCNSCLCPLKLFDVAPPSLSGRTPKRYFTNCNHVLCQNCKMRHNDQCAACNKPCRSIEINNEMRPCYRTYFEPMEKLRTNLIGAVQFESVQSEHIISRMITQGKHLQVKCREKEQKLAEAKNANNKALADQRKILIIFNKIREEKKRYDEKMRQRRLAEEQYRRARQHQHQHRQQQPNRRPTNQQTPHWFGGPNQNYEQVNNGWTPGFGATTTAQTNFDETPQTFHPFRNAPAAAPSQPQPNFMDPFSTINNKF